MCYSDNRNDSVIVTLGPRRTRPNQFHFRNLSSSRSHIKRNHPIIVTPNTPSRSSAFGDSTATPRRSTAPAGSLYRRDPLRPPTEAPSRADPPASGDSATASRGSTTATPRCSTAAAGSFRRHDVPMPSAEAPSRVDPSASGDSAAAAMTRRGVHPGRAPTPPHGSLNNGLGHRIYGFQKGTML
jgi:hypothetical protein